MKKSFKLAATVTLCSLSSFAFAQTVDKDQYNQHMVKCSQEFQKLKESPDSQALAKALVEVASSSECGGSIKGYKVEQTTLTRGMSTPPNTNCIIKLKSLTGDIGFSDIGAGDIKLLGTDHKIHWDNLHMKKVSKMDHLKSISKQLKDKGICSFDIKDNQLGIVKVDPCREYNLEVTDFEPLVGNMTGVDITRVSFNYYDNYFGKKCEVQVTDDDGMAAISLVMLQVKEKAQSQVGNSVSLSVVESRTLKDAIFSQAKYTKSIKGTSGHADFVTETQKLNEVFADILKEESSNKMSKEKFSEALKYVGSRISKHVYSRKNSCTGTQEYRNLDKLLFAPGQQKLSDWSFFSGKPEGCYVKVKGIETSEEKEQRKKKQTGVNR